ncbi:hypothetical protein GC197_06970 [bacterium]|nr:hypothetical protein [bacterium]
MADSSNPFASPKADSESSLSKQSRSAEMDWPTEAAEVAVFQEIEPPLGQSMEESVAGARRHVMYFVIGSSLATFLPFALVLPLIFFSSSNLVPLVGAVIPQLIPLVLPAALFLGISVHWQAKEDVLPYLGLRNLLKKRRASGLPSVHSPNSQLVAITPRQGWSLPLAEQVQQYAIMMIDPYASRIVLEGFDQRVWIPGKAILNCAVDHFTVSKREVWIVALTVKTERGPHELCLKIGNAEQIWQSNSKRQAEAEKYWNRIQLLTKTFSIDANSFRIEAKIE